MSCRNTRCPALDRGRGCVTPCKNKLEPVYRPVYVREPGEERERRSKFEYEKGAGKQEGEES